MISKKQVELIFNDIVEHSQQGYKLLLNDIAYLRFDLNINNKRFDKYINDDEFIGKDVNNFDDEYVSNGSSNYIPYLIIKNKDEFINKLFVYVNLIFNKYKDLFNKSLEKYSLNDILSLIIMSLFSNATYVDYNNPIEFLNKNINFILDNSLSKYKNTTIINDSDIFLNSNIICSNELDVFGYETPYIFKIKLLKDNYEYNLPIINYGIRDGVCYIYSIQNKVKNMDNDYTKKIKRIFNKVNENINNEDMEYDTIKNVPPSFVFTLNIFMNILKNNDINNIRVITFLPDRYFEKESSDRIYADEIQNHITNKLILLFYRMKEHYNSIDLNYPLYDLYYYGTDNPGNDLFLDITNKNICLNNKLLNYIDENTLSKKTAKKF